MAQVITSRQNPRIKTLVSLRKRRERQRLGLMVIEGYEELFVALRAGVTPIEIYYCPDLMANSAQLDLLQHRGLAHAEPFELNREAFERAAYREGPDGWLAVATAIPTGLSHLKLKTKTPLILVCETVEKPGNLGAILRTADAAGVDAVIATNAKTDWSNPNVVRASKGAVFAVPVAEAQPDELLQWVRQHSITIIASTPDTTLAYTNAPLSQAIALLVGSEKFGLSDFWLQQADYKVRIPMFGKVDSLNVATSAALLAYEAVRQRIHPA